MWRWDRLERQRFSKKARGSSKKARASRRPVSRSRSLLVEPLEERMLLDAGALNPHGAEVILAADSAPTIIVEGGNTIAEGAEYSLTLGEITDPGNGTVTEWIVHWGDGQIDTYETGGEKTHTYTDDDPSGTASDPYTITVDLSDEHGIHAGAGGKEITVTNVAPAVEILGPPILRPEGTEFLLTSGVTDPGSADTFTYAWTMTRDGFSYPAQTDADFRFTPDDSGNYEVTLTVTDDDGGVGTKTAPVSVVNVAPTILLTGDNAVDEGKDYTLTLGTITDPGEDTVTRWTVNWGDGLSDTYDSGGDQTHVYENDGTYTITVDLEDEDGTHIGAGSLDLTVNPVRPLDLGPIDFLLLEHLSLADGSLYFRTEATREGFFTLQIDIPEPSKSARLKLYDADPLETTGLTPLAKSSLDENGNQRIDWPTSAGTVYYVMVYGGNVDFDLRIANLLYHDAANGIVTVLGTEGDDTFEFDASASRDVTINGVRYAFEDAEVDAVTFNAGQGFDIVEIRNSPGDDTLEAWPNMMVLSNGPNDATLDFNVEATGFEDLQAYAVGGGSDKAILHGSSGDDKLKGYLSPDDDFVRLRAKDQAYSLRAKLFAEVVADAGTSGNDLAVFAGSDGNDTFRFTGSENTASIERPGRIHAATAFDRVIARAGQGDDDMAYFTDMPGEGSRTDDVFYFKPHKTQLIGQAVKVTARAFDEVHAENNQGGFGVARLYDTSEDDHFEFIGDTARVYRRIGSELDLLYETTGFDRVKAYRSTGDDTKNDQDHEFGDQLFLYGWEE